jgi:hypothetical protein
MPRPLYLYVKQLLSRAQSALPIKNLVMPDSEKVITKRTALD